jgi:DNA-binding CsgD family transcriptional regulator
MLSAGTHRDTSGVSGRLTASRLVGRHGELAELELAFRDAAEGRPGVILLGGDSGVGKTRLLAEFERSLDDRAQVLRGEALEQGEAEMPYAPLLGALRPLVRTHHPALEALSDGGRAHLASLLPSLGGGAGGERMRLIGDGAGQLQLFESLLELFDALSSEQPLVLLLEDMHWADRSTRAFSAYLARSLRRERLLLVLSYRTDELHRRHPLRPLLAELDRVERARRLDLQPLDRAELGQVLTDLIGRRPDELLVDRLMARTEGNPLYVEELLAAGLDGRGAAPQSLHDAFMLRIERLPAGARLVARAVAVGARLDERLVAAATGIEGSELNEALRANVAEHVLVTGDDDRFQFRHALLREALYDDLLPGERGELHLLLARALDGREPAACIEDEIERVAQISSHYAAAGDQPAALRATVRAALEGRRAHAHGDVAELAERALELWPRVEDAETVAGSDRVELLELAASNRGVIGDWTRAEQLWTQAVAAVDPVRDPLRHGHLLARLAKSRWKLNRGAEALELAEQALVVMAPLLDDDAQARGEGEARNRNIDFCGGTAAAERAAVQSWLARTRVLRGQYRQAVCDGEEALEAARASGEEWVVGEVLNTLGMARIALGDVERGEAQLREAVAVARELDDADDIGTAYANLADLLNLSGRAREALEVIEEGLAETPPRLRRTFAWMEMTQAELAFVVGDWDKARAIGLPAANELEGVALMFRLLFDAELALGDGDHELATERLNTVEPLVRVTSEAQWHGQYGSVLGELRRREGDLTAAQQAVQRALDELEVCTDDVMRIARVSAVGASVEADRALRAGDLRDDAVSRDALARTEIHLSRLDAASQDGGPVEQAWLAVGHAELARARGECGVAASLWVDAAAAFDGLQRPYPAATARWRAAEALAEQGNRESAAAEAGAALEVARRLGAGWLRGELEALCARARLTLETTDVAAAEPGDAIETVDEAPFGLTPRELQVLALLASGATNRQIGNSLFMAEKTASVHVSRILAKLGVQSRTQAAAVAHRLHLASAAPEPGPAATR